MKKILNILLIYMLSFVTQIVLDTISLKSGKVYENVKTKINKDNVSFTLDEKEIRFAKSDIKSIIFRAVILSKPKNESEKKLNEQEKIRISEALTNTTDFEIDPEKKLQFAIFNFQGGSGISEEELDLLEDLMTSNLVKTKLFVILDRTTINKVLEEKAGVGCSKNLEICKLKLNEIGILINAPKILTANVNTY